MEKIANLIPKSLPSDSSDADLTDSGSISQVAGEFDRVNQVFARLREMFGGAWEQSYERDGVRETWGKGLATLRTEQIADGLRAVMRSGYQRPPSCPQFIRRCLERTRDAAWSEFLAYCSESCQWVTMPEAYAVIRECPDWYDLRGMSLERLQRLFDDKFMALNFRALPEIPQPTDAPQLEEAKPCDRETALAKLAEMRRRLGL